MRKLLLVSFLGIISLMVTPAKAQVSLSVNIGIQPKWGPSGYNHVDYYYLPEVESYYYVPTKQFIYYNENRWVHSRILPSRYRGYDLYRGRKIVINSPKPYLHHVNYSSRYGRPVYRHNRPTKVIVKNHYRVRNEHSGRGNHYNHNRFGGGRHH